MTTRDHWVKLRASAATLERAREEALAMKAKHGEGFFEGDATSGRLAEYAIDYWARWHGWPVELNGGFDSKPDLVVNGWRLGAKGRSIPMSYMHDAWALVTAKQQRRPWDYWVFCAVLKEDMTRVWIMGCLTPLEMREAGSMADPGNRKVAALKVTADMLTKPVEFERLLALPR